MGITDLDAAGLNSLNKAPCLLKEVPTCLMLTERIFETELNLRNQSKWCRVFVYVGVDNQKGQRLAFNLNMSLCSVLEVVQKRGFADSPLASDHEIDWLAGASLDEC